MADDAARALSFLHEISPELRGCAILSADGEVLAASGDGRGWGEGSRALLAAADAGGEQASHAHVATEDGEVYFVREEELAAVAVTERFVLASLVIFDLRAVLRDLAGTGALA